jgi:hypothetical protein
MTMSTVCHVYDAYLYVYPYAPICTCLSIYICIYACTYIRKHINTINDAGSGSLPYLADAVRHLFGPVED